MFGAAMSSAPKNNGDEAGSDEEEAPNNVDIHFEPIVSLPEVPYSHAATVHIQLSENHYDLYF